MARLFSLLLRHALFYSFVFLTTTVLGAEPFVWIGAVTSSSFTIHIDVPKVNASQILLSTSTQFSNPLSQQPANSSESLIQQSTTASNLRRYTFQRLQPLTKYHIAIRSSSSTRPIASVRTFPLLNSTQDITFSFASCQLLASQDGSFEDIYNRFKRVDSSSSSPTFFMMHMGDLHYGDIRRNDISLYRNMIRNVITRPTVKRVMSSMPMPYMYDDHDYGKNNAGFSSTSRQAALQAYRRFVPTYNLPSENASYHAFSVGRVRFIITDLRAFARKEDNSTLSSEQRDWLFSELSAASNYSVVVWMSSKPWIGRAEEGGDSWSGFAAERQLIADQLVSLKVTNLVMISGDAHMLAADSGMHSDYSRTGGGGFPVFQAAPLSHFGTSKGGPYSEGCHAFRFFPNKQYGILKLSKLGQEGGPCVRFDGYRRGESESRIVFEKCGRLSGVEGSAGNESSCSLSLFPAWVAALIGLGTLLVVVTSAVTVVLIIRRRRRKRAEV
ncbi:Alkaline phosphatase D [Gracilariopsis chorda]|uniref:Alkaline phosphatase D n=1 Tax=Gracilariopsis chorda TaxID=448386 RepID=A0A2V3IZL5_9FLOR|nr:Alkaline phosphatase D [Gracilariopsis chorda]|eukprot:PXF47515.1 Alkaline phosphatase D [Gracilariopsis chorda]